MNPVMIPNLVVVLSHHDDEALFVGGLLLARKKAGVSTALITVCDVSVENPIADPELEAERQKNRLSAYQAVCKDLGLIWVITLNMKFNLQASHDLIEREDFMVWTTITASGHNIPVSLSDTVVLTHSNNLTIEHPQHLATSQWVRRTFPKTTPILMYGDETAPLQVPIDLEAKQALLYHYRFNTTRTPEWDPSQNPKYAPWCRDHEGYKWFGVDTWLKDGSRYGIKQISHVVGLLQGKSGSLVDLGTGNGELLRILREEGWETDSLLGQDIEPRHVALARLRTGVEILVGDAVDLPKLAPNRTFDFITAIGWLHNDWTFKFAHDIPKREAPREDRYTPLAKVFWDSLNPGGEVFYTCRDEYELWEKALSDVGFQEIQLLSADTGIRRAIKRV